MMKTIWVCALALGAAFMLPARPVAADLAESFEAGYTAGDLNGQNGWSDYTWSSLYDGDHTYGSLNVGSSSGHDPSWGTASSDPNDGTVTTAAVKAHGETLADDRIFTVSTDAWINADGTGLSGNGERSQTYIGLWDMDEQTACPRYIKVGIIGRHDAGADGVFLVWRDDFIFNGWYQNNAAMVTAWQGDLTTGWYTIGFDWDLTTGDYRGWAEVKDGDQFWDSGWQSDYTSWADPDVLESFLLINRGTGRADNLSMTSTWVPEPMTAALLALGMAPALRRRRQPAR